MCLNLTANSMISGQLLQQMTASISKVATEFSDYGKKARHLAKIGRSKFGNRQTGICIAFTLMEPITFTSRVSAFQKWLEILLLWSPVANSRARKECKS